MTNFEKALEGNMNFYDAGPIFNDLTTEEVLKMLVIDLEKAQQNGDEVEIGISNQRGGVFFYDMHTDALDVELNLEENVVTVHNNKYHLDIEFRTAVTQPSAYYNTLTKDKDEYCEGKIYTLYLVGSNQSFDHFSIEF